MWCVSRPSLAVSICDVTQRQLVQDLYPLSLLSLVLVRCVLLLLLQGKIQGFGSGGPGEAARSSSGHYGGIGSSGSSSSGNYGGGFRSSGSSGLAAAQQAASQLTHAAQQALGDGPIAQGLASAVNSLGGLLQPAGYGSRLNVSAGSLSSVGKIMCVCHLCYIIQKLCSISVLLVAVDHMHAFDG
jgi:hypothetical protein